MVGEYDEIVDKSVNDLQKSTTAFVSKLSNDMESETGSYEKNKQFYSDVKGIVTTLINRASILEDGLKKTPLSDNFENLLEQYDDLENLHKIGLNENVLDNA